MSTDNPRARESRRMHPYLTTPREASGSDQGADRTALGLKSLRDSQREITKSQLDGFLNGAKISLLIGIFPILSYWFAFTEFHSSTLSWKIAIAIYIFSPTSTLIHHLLNRRTKRLIWVGVAASIGMLQIWMLLGSYWLFYFCFAPIPSPIRATALTLGFVTITYWTWLTWRAFARNTERKSLKKRLYEQQETRIVYSAASALIVATLGDLPGDSIVVPFRLFSVLSPIVIAASFVSNHAFRSNGGPHFTFIILSAFSLPATCWLLKHFFIRFAYFHIYLPIKLERSTGKPVIFDA